MIRKQIGHFVIVSLKYFFDLDPIFSSHALLMILVSTGIIKLSMVKLAANIHDGLLQDFVELKAGILSLRERWENSATDNWRLK
jgi:hypothetical protein